MGKKSIKDGASAKNSKYVDKYGSAYPNSQTNSHRYKKNDLNPDCEQTEKQSLFEKFGERGKKAAKEFGKRFEKIHDIRNNDDEKEQITRAAEIKEKEYVKTASNKSKSKSELLAEEIEKNHHIFSALLPMSMVVLESIEVESIPLTAASLLNKWKYSLSIGSCETLLQELNSFILEDTAETTASLRKWMDFLEKSGITQLDSNADRIIVSTQNRANYQNGYEFKDGAECLVEQHPWIYHDILIFPGMLTQMQEAETDGNGSDVNGI